MLALNGCTHTTRQGGGLVPWYQGPAFNTVDFVDLGGWLGSRKPFEAGFCQPFQQKVSQFRRDRVALGQFGTEVLYGHGPESPELR